MKTKDDTTNLSKSSELRQAELIISKNVTSVISGCLAIGRALLKIRDNRLYLIEFNSLEDYVETRWGRSHRWAYRMINAAEAEEQLNDLGIEDDIRPAAGSGYESLMKYPAKAWRDILQVASDESNYPKVEGHRTISAARIERAANRLGHGDDDSAKQVARGTNHSPALKIKNAANRLKSLVEEYRGPINMPAGDLIKKIDEILSAIQ